MKNYFVFKYLTVFLKEYIFIFLISLAIILITYSKSLSEENLFTISDVKVEGVFDVNFSRDKHINSAFINSFEMLMNKILLTRDLRKVKNVDLKEIKNLVSTFQIMEESYRQDTYKASIQISFSENKIKKFLRKKNIPFSQPENISVIFFPVLFIDDLLKSFNENFFYKEWTNIKIKNDLINFVLPIEDIDDVSKIIKMRNKIEELSVDNLVNKYDIKNYAFAFMDYRENKLKVHLKIKFNNSKIRKNILFEVNDINNKLELNSILEDLKLLITDIWKEQNLINLLMPLSIKIKFNHKDLNDFTKFRDTLDKINIVDNYSVDEFNINTSYYKIYYYGNPKKLRAALSELGYFLKTNQGVWQVYLYE